MPQVFLNCVSLRRWPHCSKHLFKVTARKYFLLYVDSQTLFFIYKNMSSKDSHDPGWNDPPIFTYDKAAAIQAAAANKRGISLNKRVAFPISSNLENKQKHVKGDSSPGIDTSRPPPMPVLPSLSSASPMKSDTTAKIEVEIGSKETLEKVLKNLEVEANHDEEIIKRIRIMEKMWIDGKLQDKVQSRVLELSEALVLGDTDAADRIQMALMVDYVSQCSSWMSGIRHLINQKK